LVRGHGGRLSTVRSDGASVDLGFRHGLFFVETVGAAQVGFTGFEFAARLLGRHVASRTAGRLIGRHSETLGAALAAANGVESAGLIDARAFVVAGTDSASVCFELHARGASALHIHVALRVAAPGVAGEPGLTGSAGAAGRAGRAVAQVNAHVFAVDGTAGFSPGAVAQGVFATGFAAVLLARADAAQSVRARGEGLVGAKATGVSIAANLFGARADGVLPNLPLEAGAARPWRRGITQRMALATDTFQPSAARGRGAAWLTNAAAVGRYAGFVFVLGQSLAGAAVVAGADGARCALAIAERARAASAAESDAWVVDVLNARSAFVARA
jgi:hypothetical protein